MSSLMTTDADLLFLLVMCVMMALFVGIHLGRMYQVIMSLGGLILARERAMAAQSARYSRSKRYRTKKRVRKQIAIAVDKSKRSMRIVRIAMHRELRGIIAQVSSLRPLASTI